WVVLAGGTIGARALLLEGRMRKLRRSQLGEGSAQPHHWCQAALSAPCTNTSARPGNDQAEAPGSDFSVPPRLSHPDQPLPFHHLCHVPLLLPRTNRSSLLTPQVAAAGAPAATPPSLSHTDQALPFHHRCQMALSVPRSTASRWPGAHDAAVGAEAAPPGGALRVSQLCQPRPSNHWCQMALSVPRTKASSRPGAHAAKAGAAVTVPPCGVQPCQCDDLRMSFR